MDEAAVRRLGRRQIDAGVHFLVPGRHDRREPDAHAAPSALRIVEILVDEANGRVPILAGAGGYDTREVIARRGRDEEGRRRRPAVGDAVLQQADAGRAVPALPRDRREHDAANRRLQRARAGPAATSSPSTLVRLASLPNIVGIKEASGNMSQMCEVCRSVPPDFLVLSGDDVVTLPLMAVGGRGVISVVSNEIPAEMSQMVEAAERGDFTAARAIHTRIMPLMQINFVESSPGPVKTAMAAMGLLEEIYRLPLVAPRPESKEKILEVLKDLNLLSKPAFVWSPSELPKRTQAAVIPEGRSSCPERARSCGRPEMGLSLRHPSS